MPQPTSRNKAVPPSAPATLRGQIATQGLKQYQVAQRAGIGETILSKILNERRPLAPETADRLTAAIRELAREQKPGVTE